MLEKGLVVGMLKQLYEIIEPADGNVSKWSSVYDVVMLIRIVASMVPLAIKTEHTALTVIDKVINRLDSKRFTPTNSGASAQYH